MKENNYIKRLIRTKYCLYRHLKVHFKRFHKLRMTKIPDIEYKLKNKLTCCKYMHKFSGLDFLT